MSSHEQTRIGADAEPLTWDGEPLYSSASMAEALFDTDAYSQIPGQTALDTDQAVCSDAYASWVRSGCQDVDDHAALMGEAWDSPGGFWENRERNA